MEIRYRLYSLGRVVSLFVGVAGGVFLGGGFAEAVAPSLLAPGQRFPAAAAVFLVGLVAFLGFGRLRTGRWYTIGRKAGLRPAGGSGGLNIDIVPSFGQSVRDGPVPDLEGEINGWPVTVSTYTVKKNSGGEGGSSSQTYTLVEAALSRPTDVGAVIGAGVDASDLDAGDVLPGRLEATTVDDRFVAIGNIGEHATRELLDGRARTAVVDIQEGASGVTIGDPTGAIMSALPDDMGLAASFVAGKFQDALQKHPPFDDGTVSISSRGVLLDPRELERQAEAVAVVATAVERLDSGASPTETDNQL